MRLATAVAAVALVLALCAAAAADIPEVVSYQGVLRDGSGAPVPDGTYDITFRLYDVATGGTALWEETQSLPVEGTIVNAHLGSVVSLSGLDFLVPYWLGIDVEGEGELVPRTMWTTVPYAGHAAFADHLTYGGWETDGGDIYYDAGDVGIGAVPVDARLDVVTGDGMAADFSNGSVTSPTVQAHNAGGTVATFFSCTDPYAPPTPPAAVYARGACGARGGHFYSSSAEAVYATTTGTETALLAEAQGTGYAAQFLGDAGIQVQYQADVGSFRMYGGSSPGYVLTCDADGVGTWQPAAGDDGDWIFGGANLIAGNEGYVGIGVMAPVSKLAIETDDDYVNALGATHTGSPARVVDIQRTTAAGSFNDIVQIGMASGSADNAQFIECERGGAAAFQVNGDGSIVSAGGAEFYGDVLLDGPGLEVWRNTGPAVDLTVEDMYANSVLSAVAPDVGGTMDGAAVYGAYTHSDDYGIGGRFEGGWRGVYATSTDPDGTMAHYGVYGLASGGSVNYGVYGSAQGSGHYGGYFNGNVHVNGTLTAVTKSFKIDHPLDPANKYLLHACVESDEMTNLYTGNVTLDASGKATVELPAWFEALNTDFRYQLTAIGAPGPNLYIARRISGSSFEIAGGDPGMDVSWQVTGVRNDASARALPMVVEQDKPADEVGTYLQPEAFGMPESAGVHHETNSRQSASVTRAAKPAPRETTDPNDGE